MDKTDLPIKCIWCEILCANYEDYLEHVYNDHTPKEAIALRNLLDKQNSKKGSGNLHTQN